MAKLVFHVPSLIGGGAERVWVLLANEMARRGHDTTLLVWNGAGPNRQHVAPQVQLVDFGIPLFAGERFGKPATLRGVWRTIGYLRHHRPDAVFSAPEFANLMTALPCASRAIRQDFFPVSRGSGSARQSRWLGTGTAVFRGHGAARHQSDSRVARHCGRSGRQYRRRADRGHSQPLPPPSNQAAEPSTWMQALAEAHTAGIPILITAGRLNPVKDHRTLIEAFALLRRTMAAKLVILGDGPLRTELGALIAERGLDDAVLLPGFVADIRPALAASDLFVLTSTSEGFGNVIVEAMAAGVPVVSTDCPHGPREILDNGALGELVPVGDAPAIAAAMARMLANPTNPDRLKARAADFSITRIGDQYEALLKFENFRRTCCACRITGPHCHAAGMPARCGRHPYSAAVRGHDRRH